MTASQVLAGANAPAAAQLKDESASANVAISDEFCRRRNWLRSAWPRNQNWIEVAEAAAATTPSAVMRAEIGARNASAMMNGPKMIASTAITALILARTAQVFVTGAEAMRFGAYSPEIASQARLPANCPAAMISIGTSSAGAPLS
jgi:hypothetical protein